MVLWFMVIFMKFGIDYFPRQTYNLQTKTLIGLKSEIYNIITSAEHIL